MPEGAKVGEVYVEGRLEYDGTKTPAFMSALQRDLNRHMPQIAQNIKDMFPRPIEEGISEGIHRGVRDGGRRAERDSLDIGKGVGRLIALGAGMGIADHARLLRDAMVIALAGAAAAITVGIGAAIQAAFAIGPAALGVLPGLLLSVASAAGILKIAMNQVSESIEFGMKKEAAELREIVKDMPRGLAELALAVNRNKEAFSGFQEAVQNAFLVAAPNVVRNLAVILTEIRPQAEGVAFQFGQLAKELVAVAASAENLQNLRLVLSGITSFFMEIRPAVNELFDAFIRKSAEASEYADDLGRKINEWIQKVADWLNNNPLEKLFAQAKPAMEDVQRILDALVGTFKNLFGGDISTQGGGPLDWLADLSEGIERASVHVRELFDWLGRLPDPIKELAGAGALVAAAMLPLSSLAGSLSGLATTIGAIGAALGALGVSAGGVAAIITGVGAALVAIGAVFVIAYARSEEFRKKIEETGDMVMNAWEQDIRPAIEAIGREFDETLTAVEELMAEFGLDWGDLGEIIKATVGIMLIAIVTFLTGFREAMNDFQDRVRLVTAIIEALKDAWEIVWDQMQLRLQTFRDFWNMVIVPAFNAFITTITTGLNNLRMQWQTIWAAIQLILDTFKNYWSFIVIPAWNSFIAQFTGSLTNLQGIWTTIWGIIQQVVDGFRNWLHTVLGPGVSGFFQGVLNALAGFGQGWQTGWNNVAEAVRGPVNRAIEFMNHLVQQFKEVASKFGINLGIGNIPGISGDGGAPSSPMPSSLGSSTGFRGLNKGGYVHGAGFQDSVPAMLTPGEGVLTKKEIWKIGGPAGFAKLRQGIQHLNQGGVVGAGAGMPKMATGGIFDGLSAEQFANARIIAMVAAQMGLGPNAVQIALATALQESGLRNINFGDRDSVGLFQQRPSQGWGTVAQIMDPAYAARKFFEGLMGVQGWQGMGLSQAAQAVQKSAFPDAYGKWAGTASSILGGADGILEMLFKPLLDLVEKLKAAIPNFGDHPFGQMLRSAIMQVIEMGKKWVMENFSFGISGSGGGIGWKAMEAIITKLVPGSRVSSGFRPGSRAPNGNLDYHSMGRAIDIVPSPGPIANAIVEVVNKLFKPVTRELIHTPAGGKQIHNGRNTNMNVPGHFDHVHWAMDNGGVLPPKSETLVRNATSSREFALTEAHLTDIVGGGEGGDITVHNYLTLELDGSAINYIVKENNVDISRGLRQGKGRHG
jgi:hypothetical protein